MEQKGKRTHGHGRQCSDWWGEEGIKGLNGNKKYNKKARKITDKQYTFSTRRTGKRKTNKAQSD